MSDAKSVRRYLKTLETKSSLVDELRVLAKTEGGRMTEFGRTVLAAAKSSGVKQAYVAKLLHITPGAVSQHYGKHG